MCYERGKLLQEFDDIGLVYAKAKGMLFCVNESVVHASTIASRVGCVATHELLLLQRYEVSSAECQYALESAHVSAAEVVAATALSYAPLHTS